MYLPKTADELMSILSKEIDDVIAGKSDPTKANAIYKMSNTMLRIVCTQISYCRLHNKRPNIRFLGLPKES